MSIKKKGYCLEHDERLVYDDDWGCFYCPYCNEWKGIFCDDLDCVFKCWDRPKRPLKKKKVWKKKDSNVFATIAEKKALQQNLLI